MRLTALIALLLATTASAATLPDAPPTTQGAKADGLPLGKKGEWVPVPITIGKIKSSLCGVSVDRANGDVYVLPNHSAMLHAVATGFGVWKSTDHAATFVRVDDAINDGCGVWGGLDMDPTGGRLAIFCMYGQSGLTLDGGKT